MAAGKVIDGTAFYDRIAFNVLWTRVTSACHGVERPYPSMITGDPRLGG